MFDLKNEIIPVTGLNNIDKGNIIDELLPAYEVKDEYIVCDEDSTCMDIDNVIYSSQTDANSEYVMENEIENHNTEYNSEISDSINTEAISEEIDDAVEASSIISNIPENIGINYSLEQLSNFEFLINNCYTIDGSTSVTQEDINVESLLGQDLSLDLSGEDYKVLIYHSHGSEAFIDSRPGVSEDTIIGVGDELARILEEDYGIKVYHDRTVYDIVDGKLDRNYAYTQSGYGIDKILSENPSIEVVLDIHRDGVRDDVHLMKVIDGKPTAQIMFFNGISRLNDEGELGYLYNPNLSSNLSFSLQMHLKGKSLYGDLMRRIYIGGYCYNLDRKPRASLVEVGAQTNTVEEAKNAMIPLAAILYSVLSEN